MSDYIAGHNIYRMHNKPGVIGMLAKRVTQAGSQQKFATNNGLSPAYVSEVLRGTRDPGESILKALKLKKVVFYEEITNRKAR